MALPLESSRGDQEPDPRRHVGRSTSRTWRQGWLSKLSALFGTTLVMIGSSCSPHAQGTAKGPESKPAAQPITFPKIDRHPGVHAFPPAHRLAMKPEAFPHYNPRSGQPFQVDLRSRNLSSLDLSGRLDDLLQADFDTQTTWPPTDRLPKGFDWRQSLELGKNPGLGVRGLHERGITGRGIGIAIVDQPLLIEHREYADRLRLYEEIGIRPSEPASMHGPAVASLAVGRTIGVAPEADLYYIAGMTGHRGLLFGWTYDFHDYAQGVRRVLEINDQLPANRKIRVIAIQVGWQKNQRGYDEITAACAAARAAGLLVVSSSIEQVHGLKFHGLGRSPLADPDRFESYRPGSFWAREFPRFAEHGDRLLVPMDARTLASHVGTEDYFFSSQGGWSWSIPYLAGAYCLAAQVHPSITPEEFWSLALKTGRTIRIEHGGKQLPLGPILDPVTLIAALGAAR